MEFERLKDLVDVEEQDESPTVTSLGPIVHCETAKERWASHADVRWVQDTAVWFEAAL